MERIEAIEILKELADCNYIGSLSGEDIESLESAIETMRKYQEIERIIRRYDATWEFHHMKSTIDKIREVVEDGQNTIKD